jgi:hypothetical protein
MGNNVDVMERSLADLEAQYYRPAPDRSLAGIGIRYYVPRYASENLPQLDRPYVSQPDPRYRQELRAYTPPPPPFRPPVPLMERVLSGRPISPTPEDQESIKHGGRNAGHHVQGLTDIPRNMMHLSTLDDMSVPEEYSRDPQAWYDAVRRARAKWGAETALEVLTAGRFPGAAPRGAIGMNGGGRPYGPPVPPNTIVRPDGKLIQLQVGDGSGNIFRAGSTNPGSFKPQEGQTVLSYRSSFSEPYPRGEKGVVFNKEFYTESDPRKLAPGSVIIDDIPSGHVTVLKDGFNTTEKLVGAVVKREKMKK